MGEREGGKYQKELLIILLEVLCCILPVDRLNLIPNSTTWYAGTTVCLR